MGEEDKWIKTYGKKFHKAYDWTVIGSKVCKVRFFDSFKCRIEPQVKEALIKTLGEEHHEEYESDVD